jgi:NAD(P)H-hydrate epimerase
MEMIGKDILNRLLPRQEDTHKGSFGTLGMLCGCDKMPGAAYLAACGALRSGVGLVKIAAEGSCRQVLQGKLAEPVWMAPSEIPHVSMTAFLCGCGLGRGRDEMLRELLQAVKVPAVYDADCINFFALHRDVMDELSAPYIITPHPMEFSRLTGLDVEEVQGNRIQTATMYAQAHDCVVVLKGHGTVVASPDGRAAVNTSGTHALAKGGSGDVLAGVIASLLAQGHEPFDAACIGVYAHGLAGENLAKQYGSRGVLPGDLPMEIGRILG